MNATLLVAQRELRERTRRLGFWVLLGLSALTIVAVIVVPHLMSGTDVVRVALTRTNAAEVGEGVAGAAAGLELKVHVSVLGDDASLEHAVRSERVDLGVDAEGRLVLRTAIKPGDAGGTARLVGAIRETLRLQSGLARSGLDPSAAQKVMTTSAPPVRTLIRTDAEQAGRQGTALVANILLFVMLQIYGTWVLTGVTEEKSSRVAEVLLACIRPRELLNGKVLGIGLVALAHAVLLVVTALVAGGATGASFLDQVDLAALPASIVWLMLGYAFYCLAYGAAGSMVSRAEDAQSMAFPVLLPLLVTYVIGFGVIFSDTVPLIYRILAWLPPTAPVAMSVLQLGGRVRWWEAAGSALVCVVGVIMMSRVAARIYEGSILRGGQRVKFRVALSSHDLT